MRSPTDSPWYANPPNAPQASRVIAWISILSASVYGLIVIGPLCSGAPFAFWDKVFTGAATHLIIQAVTSAFSWKAGALCARISLGLLFPMACLPIVFDYDLKILSVFTLSSIVSLAAVKIDLDQSQPPNGG